MTRVRTASLIGVVVISVLLAGVSSIALAADGKSLAEVNCVRCHTAEQWQGVEKSADEWNKIVDRMLRNGANQWITDESARQIKEYLVSQGAPPAAPKAVPVAQTVVASTPQQQAFTGAEVWLFLLGGGAMATAGLVMRRKLKKA